ncbi:MFS transporter [Clostridium intestinale]|uniref:MFS transporter n=1 Tax=Clostridium intestinale TaxID=36845 RepID=UPI002DD69C67|nr:MFS transporter [Clostridium intestinale]WRY51518.1 MFS transporter [Clostridium intestinale]
MNNNNLKLKTALLSCCFVTASMNAISGNIPEMAKVFNTVPLYVVELISTIPSLFQMVAILIGRFMGKKIGYKNNVLLGILLCGVGGIIPIFIKNIYVILFTRGVFGFGAGLITSTLITLIVYFFDGKTRSTMIGMQGGIGGLGSLIATFIAGRLLIYGWNVSFYTYFIAFIILGIFAAFVPSVNKNENVKRAKDKIKEENKISINTMVKILGYAGIMFISVSAATLYIIKCSTLVTTLGYGKSQDGSTIIMFISAGSLISGALYGRMVHRMKKLSLPIFYTSMVSAYIIAAASNNLSITLISGFILGFGYMAFVPYIQDTVHKEFSNHGEIATSIILVGQSSGAFFAPYLGNMINISLSTITGVFFTGAIIYGGLTLLALVLAYKIPKKAI